MDSPAISTDDLLDELQADTPDLERACARIAEAIRLAGSCEKRAEFHANIGDAIAETTALLKELRVAFKLSRFKATP